MTEFDKKFQLFKYKIIAWYAILKMVLVKVFMQKDWFDENFTCFQVQGTCMNEGFQDDKGVLERENNVPSSNEKLMSIM